MEMKTSVELISKQMVIIAYNLSFLSYVTKQQSVIQEKDKKIQQLEERADNLEQDSHKDNLIITCVKTKHETLAWATSRNAQHVNEGENASDDEMQSFEKQVITFQNTKFCTCIESSDISTCHSIGNKI